MSIAEAVLKELKIRRTEKDAASRNLLEIYYGNRVNNHLLRQMDSCELKRETERVWEMFKDRRQLEKQLKDCLSCRYREHPSDLSCSTCVHSVSGCCLKGQVHCSSCNTWRIFEGKLTIIKKQ